jgi:hypothetical protein
MHVAPPCPHWAVERPPRQAPCAQQPAHVAGPQGLAGPPSGPRASKSESSEEDASSLEKNSPPELPLDPELPEVDPELDPELDPDPELAAMPELDPAPASGRGGRTSRSSNPVRAPHAATSASRHTSNEGDRTGTG